jgi:integrase
MARAPFSVFKRPDKGGKAVFSARFFGEEGEIVSTRRLKAKNRTQAIVEAKRLLDQGAGLAQTNPPALDFLLGFWSESSIYARGRALRGRPLSVRYLEENRRVIARHLAGPLQGVRLRGLTAPRLERIILELADAGVSPRTINYALQAVRVPITWNARQHRVPDPLEYLEKVAEAPRVRGCLTMYEVRRIIDLRDESPRIRAALLLGALCGCRLGEIRGLLPEDIDKEAGVVHIKHNFVDEREGLKVPKSGSTRDVPLPALVLEALELCLAIAPAGSRFVIFNEKTADKPIEKNSVRRGFVRTLARIGIGDEERKARALTPHGLRHFYVSAGRAAGLPDFTVQRLAGHKSAAMMLRYSNHSEVVDFAAAKAALEAEIEPAAPVAAAPAREAHA